MRSDEIRCDAMRRDEKRRDGGSNICIRYLCKPVGWAMLGGRRLPHILPGLRWAISRERQAAEDAKFDPMYLQNAADELSEELRCGIGVV